jgi:hypothetical protein
LNLSRVNHINDGSRRSVHKQIQAESVSALQGLTVDLSDLLWGWTMTNSNVLTSGQVAALTEAQVAQLTTAQVAGLTSAEVGGLSALQLDGLTAKQIGALSAAQLGGLAFTYKEMLAILQDDAAGGMNATKFAALQEWAAKLNVAGGVATSAYLASVFAKLVDGSALNADYTGGKASPVALGNLSASSSQAKVTDLIDKWFLGTDYPSSRMTLANPTATVSLTYSAVSTPLYSASAPKMSDVNQGYAGDCFLMAALAETASQDPSAISSMITSNGNGAFGVRLYINGKAQYVTANNVLANGGQEFNHASDLWASVVEQAYVEAQGVNGNGNLTGNGTGYFDSGSSFSTTANGGCVESTLAEITGDATVTDYCASGSSWEADVYGGPQVSSPNANVSVINPLSATYAVSTAAVQSALVADLRAGGDVVLQSFTAAYSGNKQTLVAAHDMSVYGFDASSGKFEIYNPWGAESGQTWDTTFEVSLSTLLSAGDYLTVAAKPVAALESVAPAAPAAPRISSQTGTQTWVPGRAESYALPSNTFTDPQGEPMTYAAAQSNGAPLPAWLKFNASTHAFSGTPPAKAVGGPVEVTATDTGGLSASETFKISVSSAAVAVAQAISSVGVATSALASGLTASRVAASPVLASPVRFS